MWFNSKKAIVKYISGGLPSTGPMAEQVNVPIEVVAVAPLRPLINWGTLQLAVCVVLISVACHVVVNAHSDVTGGCTPCRVVLDSHPVGDGFKDLVLDLDHLAVGVEYFCVLHQMGGDHLNKCG